MTKMDDRILWQAIGHGNAESVRTALQNGANVNAVRDDCTPLVEACEHGNDGIVGILLDAGADARWTDSDGWSAIVYACYYGHLSTVQLLIHHDIGLLDMAHDIGWTPLFWAFRQQNSDIVRFLLESGADTHHVAHNGETTLMHACRFDNLESVRLILAAGADVEARDRHQQTALHCAAFFGARSEIVRELILQHNANMFSVDIFRRTPFDTACCVRHAVVVDFLLEMYGNKLTQDHGSITLHVLLKVAEYSFAEDTEFHPPLNPLRIILPLGKLTLKHLRTLLYMLNNLDPELIRNRDYTGKLPIHIACQTNSPVEVLALIVGLDPAALHIADSTGALPIHLLCGTTTAATEYASVRYLVEQGGVGTLAASDRQGLLPLHVLCGSTNPPLRVVQYLLQSFPGSVAVQTNAGQYPFLMAAAAAAAPESSLASLGIVYELVRATPGLVVPS